MLQGEQVVVAEHQGGDVELQLTDEAVAAQGGNQVVPGGAGDGRDEEGELLLSLLSLGTRTHRLGHQGVGEAGCQWELMMENTVEMFLVLTKMTSIIKPIIVFNVITRLLFQQP